MKKTFRFFVGILSVFLLGSFACANTSSLVLRDWNTSSLISEAETGQQVEALFTFTLSAGNQTLGNAFPLDLYWGDGSYDTIDIYDYLTSMNYSRTHIYNTEGDYTVTVGGQITYQNTHTYSTYPFMVSDSADIEITSNVATVPAPGALALAAVGMGFVRKLRR